MSQKNSKMTDVVSCLLINEEGKLLILKRSNKVRTYKGYWGVITGYVEEDEKPLETAFKEISEETGIEKDEIFLLKQMKPISFSDNYEDKNYNWNIFTFLFKLEKKDKVNIDWEHSEYEWITPQNIKKYRTVPRLKDIVSELLL